MKLSVSLLKHPIHFLALGFGSGLAPKAPGTFGTLMAVPLFVVMAYVLTTTQLYIAIALVSVVGIYICDQSAKLLGVHDHPGIVWDEFAGYFISMLFLPVNALTLLLAFGLFRFFDILKPWPIRWIDKKVAGGFGIMLDDIIAGVFANIIACLIWYYTPVSGWFGYA